MAQLKSTLWSVNAKDWFKGLILAVGTPVLILLQQLIPSWTPWLASLVGQSGALILQAALSALVAYMLKQFATDTTKVAVENLTEKGASVITPGGAVIEPITKQ